MLIQKNFVIIFSSILLCSCMDAEGLRPTPEGTGPQVVWDLTATPLPDIPLPNDFATKVDPSSPTGRRINVSTLAPTKYEQELRKRFARLDGFGTFAGVAVHFDAMLDIKDLIGHQTNNMDFSDDMVFLIDITEGSPSYGKPALLDFGRGYLPVTLPDPWRYGVHDPRGGGSNLMFETFAEDIDNDHFPDPMEDTDQDGVLDSPNIYPENGNQWDDLLIFYEKETDTLIIRPVNPLREATQYAVVLLSRLKGVNGQPVRSPFPYVNPVDQTADLKRLEQIFRTDPEYNGITINDIAFAWTFTTQSVTLDLKTIREGLYGHGTMAWLKDKFPAELSLDALKTEGSEGSAYVLSGADLQMVIPFLGPAFGLSSQAQQAIGESFKFVSHIVIGRYKSPDFMLDKDGLSTESNPQNDDEVFQINPVTGEADVSDGWVSFMCVIPDKASGKTQPFPVTLYTAGTALPKIVALGHAGFSAMHGLATCAIDAFGHGFAFPKSGSLTKEQLQPLLEAAGYGHLLEAFEGLRARDLDNDGIPDSGRDFWNNDPFHSRDTVRQTIVDWFQFVRILRSFDGIKPCKQDLNNDGKTETCGDFDGDGTPDIGTENGHYTAWGISLGGIITGVLAGIEHKLEAAVPQSGGGGLIDIAMRTTQPGVPQMVVLPALGALIVGEPSEAGGTDLKFLVSHFDSLELHSFATVLGILPGDRIRVDNIKTKESKFGLVMQDGSFRVGIAADALLPSEMRAILDLHPEKPDYKPVPVPDNPSLGDPFEVVVFGADGKEKMRINQFGENVEWAGVVYQKGSPLVFIQRGMGKQRQSPDLRKMFMIAQTAVEPGDPANWAPHYFFEPLPHPYDANTPECVNVLDLITVGDTYVPVSSGVSMGRAAGIVDDQAMSLLVEHKVIEGLWKLGRYRTDGTGPHPFDPSFDPSKDGDKSILFDVDNLDENLDGFDAPSPEKPLRITIDTPCGGKAGLRIAYVNKHGSHALTPVEPDRPFDILMYGAHLLSRYMVTGGKEIIDDICLEDQSCDFIAK